MQPSIIGKPVYQWYEMVSIFIRHFSVRFDIFCFNTKLIVRTISVR